MRRIGPVAMAAALLAGGLQAQTAPPPASADPAPMRPKGAWVAEFEEAVCVLSRGYGEGADAVRLAFRPIPGDNYLEIVLVMPHSGRQHNRDGEVEATLLPSGQRSTGYYSDYTIESGRRLLRFVVKRDELSDLASAKAIRLSLTRHKSKSKEPPRIFALTGTAKALETIRTCEDDLIRRWGFDPDVLRGLAQRAEPVESPQSWVTNSDYPSAALSGKMRGSVRFRLTVDEEGRAAECKINQSSGYALLDDTACRLLLKRARFKPAIGADGKPTRVPWSSTFTWMAWF